MFVFLFFLIPNSQSLGQKKQTNNNKFNWPNIKKEFFFSIQVIVKEKKKLDAFESA